MKTTDRTKDKTKTKIEIKLVIKGFFAALLTVESETGKVINKRFFGNRNFLNDTIDIDYENGDIDGDTAGSYKKAVAQSSITPTCDDMRIVVDLEIIGGAIIFTKLFHTETFKSRKQGRKVMNTAARSLACALLAHDDQDVLRQFVEDGHRLTRLAHDLENCGLPEFEELYFKMVVDGKKKEPCIVVDGTYGVPIEKELVGTSHINLLENDSKINAEYAATARSKIIAFHRDPELRATLEREGTIRFV